MEGAPQLVRNLRLPSSSLGSTCANFHTDGNSWPTAKLNWSSPKERCRDLGKMVNSEDGEDDAILLSKQ